MSEVNAALPTPPLLKAPGQCAAGADGRGARGREKLWIHLYINADLLAPGFDVNKKIIGRGGGCTKGIFTATGANVRLRGSGSGFLERSRSGKPQEAPMPLTLAVSMMRNDRPNFQKAVGMAVDLLRGIEERFRIFRSGKRSETVASSASRTCSAPGGCPAFWVGEISAEGLACCVEALKGVRMASSVDGSRPVGRLAEHF